MNKHFLQPGTIFISDQETIVSTILGSCISFCIYDKKNKIGGITHYQLPDINDKSRTTNKFAGPSLRNLLSEFKNTYNSALTDLEVKIIGGSRIYSQQGSDFDVGTANIAAAKELVSIYKLNVVATKMGGTDGRKIEFNTATGTVRVKSVKDRVQTNAPTIIDAPIRILVVDDSLVIQKIYKKLIQENPKYELAGCANNPLEAIEIRKENGIDVITLDVNMPHMDGITYLKSYMTTDPIPTIMISDFSSQETGSILDALEHGAFDYLKKPLFDQMDSFKSDFFHKIEAAHQSKRLSPYLKPAGSTIELRLEKVLTEQHLLVIGASTGGTEALKDVLTSMPKVIPPTLIVQHIPSVFSKKFADRLNVLCPFNVCEAESDMEVLPSTVYIAPGGQHMKIVKSGSKLRIELTDDPPINRFKPSVDYLFNSVAELKNKKVVAVIMTGMGDDGAKGLLKLKQKGALTLGQDEESCVVYGMPKEAMAIGAVTKEAPLHQLAQRICESFYLLK